MGSVGTSKKLQTRSLKYPITNQVGFKIYLGVSANVFNWSQDGKEFSLVLDENPLAEFVELPEGLNQDLWYSNILVGVIRGALEMVHMQVDVSFIQDVLRGGS